MSKQNDEPASEKSAVSLEQLSTIEMERRMKLLREDR